VPIMGTIPDEDPPGGAPSEAGEGAPVIGAVAEGDSLETTSARTGTGYVEN
jgi:hypothetical protein